MRITNRKGFKDEKKENKIKVSKKNFNKQAWILKQKQKARDLENKF